MGKETKSVCCYKKIFVDIASKEWQDLFSLPAVGWRPQGVKSKALGPAPRRMGWTVGIWLFSLSSKLSLMQWVQIYKLLYQEHLAIWIWRSLGIGKQKFRMQDWASRNFTTPVCLHVWQAAASPPQLCPSRAALYQSSCCFCFWILLTPPQPVSLAPLRSLKHSGPQAWRQWCQQSWLFCQGKHHRFESWKSTLPECV